MAHGIGDAETVVSVVLLCLSGVFIGGLGYLIRYRGVTGLIAGYDADRVTDEAALADLIGGVVLVLGGVHVAFGLGLFVFTPDLFYWSGYLVVMGIGTAFAVIRGRRYEV